MFDLTFVVYAYAVILKLNVPNVKYTVKSEDKLLPQLFKYLQKYCIV